jgi:nucleotide-binding universal stress UspA family protein
VTAGESSPASVVPDDAARTACHDSSSWEHSDDGGPFRFRRIVVGIDGSPNSINALRLAVGLGMRDGARIEAVCAYQRPSPSPYPFSSVILAPYGEPGSGLNDSYAVPNSGDSAAAAQATLERAAFTALGQVGLTDLVLRPVEGHPHEVLNDASATADLLVLGAHGHFCAPGFFHGSTAQACTRHARCAVLVVPSPEKTLAGSPDRVAANSRP